MSWTFRKFSQKIIPEIDDEGTDEGIEELLEVFETEESSGINRTEETNLQWNRRRRNSRGIQPRRKVIGGKTDRKVGGKTWLESGKQNAGTTGAGATGQQPFPEGSKPQQ